jgi:hypothetical protein
VANIIPRHGTFSAKIAPSAHISPSPSRLRKINKNQQTGVSFYHTSRLKANENTVTYIKHRIAKQDLSRLASTNIIAINF